MKLAFTFLSTSIGAFTFESFSLQLVCRVVRNETWKKINNLCLEFKTNVKSIKFYYLHSAFWLLLQVMKHLSWSSGINATFEKCFYLVWIHFYLMELRQKAWILKLRSVKMKDLRVFKSTVKIKWMKIKLLGIKTVSVDSMRCGGRNTGEQFILSLHIFTIKLSEIC